MPSTIGIVCDDDESRPARMCDQPFGMEVVVVEPLGADLEVVVAVVAALLGSELGEELVEVLDEARLRAR